MPYFLEDVDLLKDFSSRVLVLNVHFVDALDCDILSSQFVDAQSNFTKSTFAK